METELRKKSLLRNAVEYKNTKDKGYKRLLYYILISPTSITYVYTMMHIQIGQFHTAYINRQDSGKECHLHKEICKYTHKCEYRKLLHAK